MKKDFMFTSESVTEGHPDKVCDQISDAIVDHFLEIDPLSRIIAECAVSVSILFIAARFTSDAVVDFPNIARRVIRQIGYEQHEFNAKTCSILTSLQELPRDETCCVDERLMSDEDIEKMTARNQVTVFGFACDQTPAFMPLPIWLAHKLSRQITQVRRDKVLPFLCPEGKTDVGIEYRNRKPHRIHSITVTASQSRPEEPTLRQFQDAIYESVVLPAFRDETIKPDRNTEIFINPEGPFVVGGPSVHSGLTGRKTAIDTYGEYARHSGAALSGKDPLRIDRVAAYAARHAAKNIVAAGLAEECEVQLSYSVTRSRPASIQVETFGTGKIADEALAGLLEKHFEFRLAGIMKEFDLRRLPQRMHNGFYQRLAAYGHMGRTDMDLPWERTDRVDFLK
ncbi:methionine adenosyltransferase [Desulforhabdus sp. TSK]|uniref:methionine adenosyltransferase n=1 Tax=Desulforhabdus sp. TSK TaxID=2925014 RepID=UPI001FC8B432|nr:methionine adenosyltransferase [Desulforhabdus sp. TSK]GKT10158.1 S-adenosylmethionine synthase [Desulforhabdus sp. TSK]